MVSFQTQVAAVVAIAVCAPAMAVAHPFHISSAEIEYEAASDRLQVSLKLQAVDVEQALAKLAGKRIKLEQAGVSEWLVKYLDRHLYLTPVEAPDAASNSQVKGPLVNEPQASGPQVEGKLTIDTERDSRPVVEAKERPLRSRVHWVGSELKGAWMWLYFELELPPARDDLRLVNTVLFDTNTGQINTVSVRHAGQRTTLKLTSQQPSEKFPAQWMTP